MINIRNFIDFSIGKFSFKKTLQLYEIQKIRQY